MNKLITGLLLGSSLVLTSCDFTALIRELTQDEPSKPPVQQPEQKKRKLFTGKKETKFSNGQVKTSIEYKDGKRHGEAIQYYPNGHVHLSDNYIFGEREGVSKYYYQNGQVYRETDYIAGRRNGWKKEYTKSGRLKYKAGYEKGEPNGEFVEYDSDGKKKPKPVLVVKALGWNKAHDVFQYEVSFSRSLRNPRFFLGARAKQFSYSRSMIADVKNGKGYIQVKVPKGRALEMDGQFIGQGTNKFKYPIAVTKVMKISLKNP